MTDDPFIRTFGLNASFQTFFILCKTEKTLSSSVFFRLPPPPSGFVTRVAPSSPSFMRCLRAIGNPIRNIPALFPSFPECKSSIVCRLRGGVYTPGRRRVAGFFVFLFTRRRRRSQPKTLEFLDICTIWHYGKHSTQGRKVQFQ